MHKGGKQLSYTERSMLMHRLRAGMKLAEVAELMGRHRSTLWRELRRNRSPYSDGYLDVAAQQRALERRRAGGRGDRLKNERVREYVRNKLKAHWSPELIAGRIRLEHPGCSVSHETIYQYVYHLGEPDRAEYVRCLLRSHVRRRKRGTLKAARKSRIPNRIGIEQRPKNVAMRRQVGHWEGDSMVCSRNTTVLYTLVERKTRLVQLVRVRGRDRKRTGAAIILRMKPLPRAARRTLTLDNAFEHACHEAVTEELGIRCYFCDPYSAWQRGTNENRNGMVRRYFPKGTDFAKLTQAEIERAEHAINIRPMKCLGYRTPLEAAAQCVAFTG
jgi:IS30 family transposase